MTDVSRSAGVQLLELPTVPGPKGSLTFVEGERHLPFLVKRTYFLYDVPPGEQRGGLAHRAVDLCLIAVSGSMEVRLDDGADPVQHVLDRPSLGLLVPRLVWLEIACCDPATVCLVLASEFYDEADYVRDHEEFLQLVGSARAPS
ncbi:MAG TPA: FdtA/QdtA family cupin domain-containing protein [Acidimicrobiales bacterium]|nr:FdtA/QdtA family cupin domain-containing protein [Acidimicrobiales bacterium]